MSVHWTENAMVYGFCRMIFNKTYANLNVDLLVLYPSTLP